MGSHWSSVCLYVIGYFCVCMMMSQYQQIFTELDMCIDIMEIWSGIANGQISLILLELSALHTTVAGYYRFMFLSHLLVAGCDIGVRFSVRPSVSPSVSPSVRLSTFMSTFDIYVKVSILINYKTKQPLNLA